MKQYLELAQRILDTGIESKDRTGTGTISTFGQQTRYNLEEGFPLITTKKTNFDAIKHELLWFIAGDTNIQYLVKNNCNIWNEWPYESFKKSKDFKGETLIEYKEKIINDDEFAKKHGNLGPVYGKQWRDFFGKDQLKELIEQIKTNPNSRRLIVSAWNPSQIEDMALPPCHAFFQFYVRNGKLSCQLYQRSADIFLGVPFNIASYSLLVCMIAQVVGLKPGEFVHTLGDAHIYLNHLDQVNKQLLRKPYKLPTLKLNPDIKNLFDFKSEDILIENYEFHPLIKGSVAV